MKILALESSAIAASVALTEEDKLLAQAFQNSGLTHSRTLLPLAESLLAHCDVPLSAVDALAVAHGPGSFTGIRIGVATVKGLSFGASIPCVGVSTLEAMAYSARALAGMTGCNLCCVMDARAGQVYNALFTIAADTANAVTGTMEKTAERPTPGTMMRLCADRAIPLKALGEEIQNTPYFVVGDGAELCYNTLKELCGGLRLAPPELRYPTAYGVAVAALSRLRNGQGITPHFLDAVYLRKPQAERERLQRLAAANPE